MDHGTRQRNSSPLHMSCSPEPPKSRSAVKVTEKSTPISNLCNTLKDTALTNTVQVFSENVETMFVNAPQKSVQTCLNSSFLTPIKSGSHALHLSRQTPRLSVKKLALQNVEDTISTTKGIPMQISEQTLACARLNLSSEKKNVNSTPRRNPRRSFLERTLRQEEKQSNDVMNTTHLRNEICKNDSPLLTHVSSDERNDITPCSSASMESECVVSGHKKKNSIFRQKYEREAACIEKKIFDTNLEGGIAFERLNSVPLSVQSNKFLPDGFNSEPRVTRKSDVDNTISRRLSFSAKKPNKRKGIIPEYDPDNDIFAHGLMPIQFNVDSLKHEIGKIFSTSDTPSPQIKRSRSCVTLNEANNSGESTPIRCLSSSLSKKKPAKKTSEQTFKPTFKRTSSAPDLLMIEPSVPSSDIKPAPEGTIQAFLRARDIIKNIRERAKNSCKASSLSTTTENTGTIKESVASCSNERKYQSFNIEHNCDSLSSDLPPTQPFESFILGDVTAYVEVISNNEDISAGVRKELMKLGATVVHRFTKAEPVTHVVFNDGHISTYKKAKKRNIPLVSVLWIEQCRKAGVKVHESTFPPYKIERYESPSIIKQLKKRRIMHLHSGERHRPSRRRKEVPQHVDKSPSDELSKEIPKRESSQVPKWVDDVAGNNGVMRILVKMTGIGHSEFQNLVNRPPTPDSDIEPDLNSPLALRLLRKMAKNLPIDNNNCDDNSKTNDSTQLNSPSENSFAKKLTAVTEIENEKVHEHQFVADNGDTPMVVENNQSISPDNSHLKNITHRKKVSKRKLMSPVEETVIVTGDSDNMECSTIENPHNCTPKNLSNSSLRKKKKLDSSQETNPTAVLGKESNKEIDHKLNACEVNAVNPIRRSRRSSAYFVKKKSTSSIEVQKSALVCTLLHSADIDLVVSIADKLGTYVVDKTVTERTTHIVTGSPKRTMKVLKGMVRGCWIISYEWVLKSLEAGKWLDEEEFELTTFSPAVQKYRLEKLSFGRMFKPDIFSTCGPVFVSSQALAPRGDLVELILLCGGKLTSRISKAKIAVGRYHSDVVCVTALWVLDSIQYYCRKPFDSYLCK